MYRFHYDLRKDCWVIQFLIWGIFWVTAKNEGIDLIFHNVTDAEAHVTQREINRVYVQQQSHKEFNAYMNYGQGVK